MHVLAIQCRIEAAQKKTPPRPLELCELQRRAGGWAAGVALDLDVRAVRGDQLAATSAATFRSVGNLRVFSKGGADTNQVRKPVVRPGQPFWILFI